MINTILSPKWEYTRSQYVKVFILIMIVAIALMTWIAIAQNLQWGQKITSILFVLWLLLMYVNIISIVKRLRNLWKKRSYIFLLLVPFYNIYMIIRLLTQQWTDWNKANWNKDNNQEKKSKRQIPRYMRLIIWLWVLILIWRALVKIVISVFENNPSYQLSEAYIRENSTMQELCWKFKKISMQWWSISTAWPTWEAEIQLWIVWETCDWSVYSSLNKSMGEWRINNIVFDNGSERINLAE
jgi:hypothetical protein